MKKYLIRLKKLPKLQWLVISIIVVTFFTYYGVTSYIKSDNEEEPRWMVCNPKKDDRKPLYIKFHNTDKFKWDHKKRKWVKSKNKYNREKIPTIEMYEDKSYFFKESRFLQKLRPIYQSDNYYVFYQTTGGVTYLKGIPAKKKMAQHIIMNRDDLSLLYYENEWFIENLRNRKYDDEEIDKLFKEVNSTYYSRIENIILLNGETLGASKSLDLFQCKEVSSIKPKI